MSVDQMRALISEVYPNDTWRNKVEKMHDGQVIVIYHRFLGEGLIGTEKQYTPPTGVDRMTEIKGDAAIDKAFSDSQQKVVQLTIDDILARREA